ncbi:Calcium and integrin-binding family member 3, partial [Orchesella cincta]
DCTFFTRKEILRVFKKFRELNPSLVPKTMTANEPVTVRVPIEIVTKMPELKENPFRERICTVFSRDGQGISFEDFLDLFSAFSEHAPRDIKVQYAFRIYDFDGDQFLGTSDLEKTLQLLTRDELSPDEVSLVSTKVLEEADVDDDGKLSFGEFEHVITRAPDFLTTFHIRI